MIVPWRATCVQVINHIVNDATTREEAMAIVHRSLDRWEAFLRRGIRGDRSTPQLVLFPEFALQGFPLHETAAEWLDKACFEIPGPEIARLQRVAQDLKIYIGANGYERTADWPGRYFNCSFLIDPKGDVILKYRRINTVHSPSPHDFMDRYLDKHGIEGTFPVVKTELGNVGMFPCGEIMYPEAARTLMFRGAEVILHPTSDHGVPEADMMAWECCKRARASENMVYLVSSNAGGIVGAVPSNSNMGRSKIIDYNGAVIADSGGPGESLRASALIDIPALRRARRQPGPLNRILRQRNEIYLPVFAEAHFYPANSFPDGPMDSKQRIMEIQEEAMRRLKERGIVNPA
jgi:predicted amidohydrolase